MQRRGRCRRRLVAATFAAAHTVAWRPTALHVVPLRPLPVGLCGQRASRHAADEARGPTEEAGGGSEAGDRTRGGNAHHNAEWAWSWWRSLGSPRWVCSPMVDQSERAFRLLCRRYGVGLAYTPMIHAEPFAADKEYRKSYFDAWEAAAWDGSADADRPLVAQLGGDDPETMLRAARILEPYVDAIDINFGCPTEDARVGGHKSHSPRCGSYGAYLLPRLPLVRRLVGTLASGLRKVPVTAKMRLLDTEAATLDVALAIEEAQRARAPTGARSRRCAPPWASP